MIPCGIFTRRPIGTDQCHVSTGRLPARKDQIIQLNCKVLSHVRKLSVCINTMPNRIAIERVKSQLPPFVTLYEDTYKGVRYKAKFRDIEYDQDFETKVESIIRNKTGCPQRRNDIISKQRKGGTSKRTPLENIQGKIPSTLAIDPATYTGIRNKATFTDLETGESFESIVGNIIKGTGVSPSRAKELGIRKNTLSIEVIKENILKLYGGRITLVEETYKNTQTPCLWLVNGSSLKLQYTALASGRYFCQRFISRWSSYVGVRDNFTCQKCLSQNKICCHHIISFKDESQRYNIHNGICLCSSCHNLYHGWYRGEEGVDTLIEFIDNAELGTVLRERLSLPALLPVFGL